MDGWIRTHRKVMEHWIWQDPVVFQRWMYILLLANYEDKKRLLNGVLVEYKRGELATSLIKLSADWGCDRKTVKKFLNLLVKDEMIELKTCRIGTIIKVLNYNDYQSISKDEIPSQLPNKLDDGMDNGMDCTMDTTKKDKKCNKEKNKESSHFTPPTVDEVRKYCIERKNYVDAERFVDFYEAKGWMVGRNKMKDWKASIRTWEKKDGRYNGTSSNNRTNEEEPDPF